MSKFGQGYICACTTLAQLEGGTNTNVEEMLEAGGYTTIGKLRKAGAEDFDVKYLRAAIRNIMRRRSYKKPNPTGGASD